MSRYLCDVSFLVQNWVTVWYKLLYLSVRVLSGYPFNRLLIPKLISVIITLKMIIYSLDIYVQCLLLKFNYVNNNVYSNEI